MCVVLISTASITSHPHNSWDPKHPQTNLSKKPLPFPYHNWFCHLRGTRNFVCECAAPVNLQQQKQENQNAEGTLTFQEKGGFYFPCCNLHVAPHNLHSWSNQFHDQRW